MLVGIILYLAKTDPTPSAQAENQKMFRQEALPWILAEMSLVGLSFFLRPRSIEQQLRRAPDEWTFQPYRP